MLRTRLPNSCPTRHRASLPALRAQQQQQQQQPQQQPPPPQLSVATQRSLRRALLRQSLPSLRQVPWALVAAGSQLCHGPLWPHQAHRLQPRPRLAAWARHSGRRPHHDTPMDPALRIRQRRLLHRRHPAILIAAPVQAQRQRSMPRHLQAPGLQKKPVLRPRGRRDAVEASKDRVVLARSLLVEQPHLQLCRCPPLRLRSQRLVCPNQVLPTEQRLSASLLLPSGSLRRHSLAPVLQWTWHNAKSPSPTYHRRQLLRNWRTSSQGPSLVPLATRWPHNGRVARLRRS